LKLLIHDLEEGNFEKLFSNLTDNMTIVSNDGNIHSCIGCFGCWIKTPGVCVIRDKYGDMGECLSKSDEVIIISKCFYGGFSPFVKNVIDRGISYNHPYFEIRNNEMHHKRRYENHFDLNIIFYGEDITEQEKQTAEKLIKANAINLDCNIKKVMFVQNINEISTEAFGGELI